MIINNIKRFFSSRKTHIITEAGVKMRVPYNEKGEWIGWTAEEVAAHLFSYKNIPLKEQKPLKGEILVLKEKPLKEDCNNCGKG